MLLIESVSVTYVIKGVFQFREDVLLEVLLGGDLIKDRSSSLRHQVAHLKRTPLSVDRRRVVHSLVH